MQQHTLQSRKNKVSKRVGRGGKRGSFSGRGIKGQKSRSGRRIRPEMRDLIMKIPKRRGYRQKQIPSNVVAVRASIIAKKFPAGELVTPKTLIAKGIVKRVKGKTPVVKILGAGELLKGRVVKDCLFSRVS